MKTVICIWMIILIFTLILTGCETANAKRAAIHQHRVEYCSKTADSLIKKAAITAIKAEVPLYPTEGICIGLTEDGC